MQPNQQDPNTQTGVPQSPAPAPARPLPYQVPEYLGLEPLANPEAASEGRKKKIIVLMIITFSLIIVSAIAFAAYIYVNRETPEAKFYRALDGQMQLKSIDRTLMSVDESDRVVTVEARTMFGSWDTVKTSLSYTNSNDERCEQVLDPTRFSLRCHSPSSSLKGLGIKSDTWYQADKLPANQVNRYDELELQQAINSPFDIVPVGDIGQQDRDRITAAIRQERVYKIISTQTDILDGQKVDLYKVSVDSAKFNDVWQLIADTLHLVKPYPSSTYADGVDGFSLWINDKGVVVKAKFAVDSRRQNVTILYKHSSSQDVTTPQDTQQFPGSVK